MSSSIFESICKLKDTESRNLNDLFESYGCNTLESMVPVVSDQVVEKLKSIDPEQQLYATLALKTESVELKKKGRQARTKDRNLTIECVNGNLIIAAGKQRSRSPTPEKSELDFDIDLYMSKRKRKKNDEASGEPAAEEDWPEEKPIIKEEMPRRQMRRSPVASTSRQDKEDVSKEDLDREMEDYWAEARKRAEQKKKMIDLSERANLIRSIEDMEAD